MWKQHCHTGDVTPNHQGGAKGPIRFNEDDLNYITYLTTTSENKPTLQEVREKLLKNTTNEALIAKGISVSSIHKAIKIYTAGGENSWDKIARYRKKGDHLQTEASIRYTEQYIQFTSACNARKVKFVSTAGVCIPDSDRTNQDCIEFYQHTGYNCQYAVTMLVGIDGSEGTNFCRITEGPFTQEDYINFISEAANAHSDIGEPILRKKDILVVDYESYHNGSEMMIKRFLAHCGVSYGFTPQIHPFLNPASHGLSLVERTLNSPGYYSDLFRRYRLLGLFEASRLVAKEDIAQWYETLF